MFWTILKVSLFLAAVAGLTLVIDTLLDQGGGIRVAVADTEFTLGAVQVALLALAVLAGLWLLMKLAGLAVAVVRFINGDETAVSRYFEASRKRRGLEALTEGFLALAAGEGEKAVTRARKAEKLLEGRALTNLLMAQAAQTKGNGALAADYYKRLLDDDRARFVGILGLMQQKLAEGDRVKARKLAEKALALQPLHAATQDTLLQLQVQDGDWQGARRTLTEIKRAGRLPKDVFLRRDAVLTLQQSAQQSEGGATDLAQDLAIEANAASPALVPAAVGAARALIARDKGSAAAKVLKKAWRLAPHPALAQAYAEIEPGEPPADRVRRFEKLLSLNEGDEARLIRAELLIAAEDFPAARRAIGTLHETAPSQRVFTIMAAIERGEGSDDAVVRGWLARALTAPRGAQWVCDKCQHLHADWAPVCENCEGFDTLSWRSPPDSSGPSPTGTEMLPLIVGGAARPVEPATPDEAADGAFDEPMQERDETPEEAQVIDLEATRRRGM